VAYNNAIPQPTDRLKDSQADLLGNFQAIKTLIDINHVTFDTPNQGKHKSVMMPNQVGAVPVFGATETGFYSATPIAPQPLTGVNELFIHRQDGTETIISGGDLQGLDFPLSGWSFLPSGLLIKWGLEPHPGGIPGFGLGFSIYVFPVAANIPVFSKIYNAFFTPVSLAPVVGLVFPSLNLVVTNTTQIGITLRNLDPLNPSPATNTLLVVLGIP